MERTDALYCALEGSLSPFGQIVTALARAVGLGKEGVVVGEMKDPVRTHEKALNDYLVAFDDFDDEQVMREGCMQCARLSRMNLQLVPLVNS